MTLNDFNKQAKKEERRRRFKEAKDKAFSTVGNIGRECYQHRFEIAGAIFAGMTIARSTNKLINDSRDRKRADRMIYDRKTDTWWETKHMLSNNEKNRMLDLMHQTGCTKGEALRKMGVLKR